MSMSVMYDSGTMPKRLGGGGKPPGTGRTNTAVQCSRTGRPAKPLMKGGGDGAEAASAEVRPTMSKRWGGHGKPSGNSLSNMMERKTAIRAAKMPMLGGGDGMQTASAEIRPMMRRSKKYANVPSTISQFLKTGISEPRRIRAVPVDEKIDQPFRTRNKKYDHVTSTIQEFLKTGIRQPRRFSSAPQPEKAPQPYKNENKKYKDIKSRVGAYIRKPLKGQTLKEGENKESPKKTVPKPVKSVRTIPEEVIEIDVVIANLVNKLRDVNREKPTVPTKLTSDLDSKFPHVQRLMNSEDPFESVLALGLGYSRKFAVDFSRTSKS